MSDTSTRLKIVREVSVQADGFYARAEELGNLAARALPAENQNKRRSQITNLENIANNALKVTDVVNYLKKQTGKSKPDTGWKMEHLGDSLINMLGLDGALELTSQQICAKLDLTDPVEKQRIHLLLIREFVRQLTAHYEWKVNQQ